MEVLHSSGRIGTCRSLVYWKDTDKSVYRTIFDGIRWVYKTINGKKVFWKCYNVTMLFKFN